MNDAGLVAAAGGLLTAFAFAQTSRHHTVGRLGMIVGLLTIPLFVALCWRVALDLHWWTIPVAVTAAVLAGMINGVYVRSAGTAGLYRMQPLVGGAFLILTIASWLLRD